jgi:biopolymer transport protein ExbD
LRLKRQPEQKARIELIPMIDTMAFLLVFFMIASLAMTQQLGLTVNLPRATTSTQQPASDQQLVVTIDEKGHYFLNKKPVAWSKLEGEVRARVAARPGLVVVVNADERLRHGLVVHTMDAIRRAGASQMAISTARPEDGQTGPDAIATH